MTGAPLWMARAALALATLIFILVGSRYVLHPEAAATASGMTLSSPVGFTNTRAGVGGMMLGLAVLMAVCLASPQRLQLGLWLLIGVFAPVLLVRLYGVVVDGTFAQNARIVVPETVLLILAAAALMLSSAPRTTH